MKKLLYAIILCSFSKLAAAGPVVEIYQCELNEGKTLADLSAMMDAFSEYLRDAGIADSYTAHAGFQQIPIKTNYYLKLLLTSSNGGITTLLK